jgi:hypothetical protein
MEIAGTIMFSVLPLSAKMGQAPRMNKDQTRSQVRKKRVARLGKAEG